MPGVTTAYQSGIHSARPSVTSGCILYACSTHAKVYRSDGAAWADWLTISAGMNNPMTTTGDIVYSSDGSGTPARLAIGGANTLLHGGTIPAYSAVLPADLDVSADNTTANATTGHHGLLAKLGGGTSNFLRADGTWAAPAGSTLAKGSAYVATDEGTASGSYTDLSTTGPTVTITVNTKVMVTLRADIYNSVSNGGMSMGVDVSGANTIAADDVRRLYYFDPNTNGIQASCSFIFSSLTPGSTVFKAQYYHGGSGTGHWRRRELMVECWD